MSSLLVDRGRVASVGFSACVGALVKPFSVFDRDVRVEARREKDATRSNTNVLDPGS
jgi:hypothetical protein